jgi:NAD-dependent dihydropyrimidine dehydrogenase PreA subunit
MVPGERLSLRQVQVGDDTVGLTGLDEVFAALYAEGSEPDAVKAIQLLTHVRRHNYIPPAAEADYAQALLREYGAFCQRQRAGCACAAGYGAWRGHPREAIPWYPTLRPELCDGCGACMRFCPNGVFAPADGGGGVQVGEPYKCQVGCSACVQVCKPKAITFPPPEVLEAF